MYAQLYTHYYILQVEDLLGNMVRIILPKFYTPIYYMHGTTLLPQQQKFQQMSDQIIGRLDDMGKRVDDLEKNIAELVQQVDSKDDPSNQKK